jgi:subtilisin family serine protease
MKFSNGLWALGLVLFATTAAWGQDSAADLLQRPGLRLSEPTARAEVVASIRRFAAQRREAARARAAAEGLPLRVVRPDGTVREIAHFIGDEPIYLTTQNVSAGISTAADQTRSTYATDGSTITIGMWDGGSGRASHQEFGSRMVVMDGAASITHATHVGGTLAAAGVDTRALGMAPAATVHSYDWNQDLSEMTARAATGPGETDNLYLSNHSYGYVSGWYYVNNGTRAWEWYGNGTTSSGIEEDFGRYNSFSRDQDALAHSAPYYLIFRAGGNERTNNPDSGQMVALSPGSSTVVVYDPTLHPAGDGIYRGGFETVAFDTVAKNVMVVGSTTDAVSGGVRDPSVASVSSFSSWGPTDDGRIKPDIVANGHQLVSSANGSNTAYATLSGTSMATPNAAGSAALLIQHYANLFSGGAMRSSTLKGLLIHTADDLGNAGPDYKHGWGLINVKAAADIITDHSGFPEKQRITEDVLTSATPAHSRSFVWDGVSPIRATLAWTDPAGNATTSSDLRSPRLVNDLNLKVIGPDGTEYLPFVMPFVGTWTQDSMNRPAGTGINNTDNVEQVLLAAPPLEGTYKVVVSYSGSLANDQQVYSLILSGSNADAPPPPPLSISSASPDSGLPGTVVVDLSGDSFQVDTAVKLARSGYTDIPATSVELQDTVLRCQFDLSNAAAGAWDIVVTNPDAGTATLTEGFMVIGALWSENFDGPLDGSVADWISNAVTGSNAWNLSETKSHSPARAYFAPGPAALSTTDVISPPILIPENGTALQLKFWHSYSFESPRDGGRLALSINGEWLNIEDAASGAAFASNGYNTKIKDTGNPNQRTVFDGKDAWSGNSGGFVETVVNLTDTAKFAGSTLRLRWRLATNKSTASGGWHIDSVGLFGGGDVSNQAPTITADATTASDETVTETDGSGTIFEIVRAASIDVSVGADDDSGEANLTYTWAATSGSSVFFFPNGEHSAKQATANFESAGDYQLTVSVTDPEGLTVSSSVNVRVEPTASGLAVTPAVASLLVGESRAFVAEVLDQFGLAMLEQPTSFTWTASGGGTVDTSGVYNATDAGGPFVVTASDNTFTGTASVTVNPLTAIVSLGNLSVLFDGAAHPVTVTTSPEGLAVAVTYNGLELAPSEVGSYAVEAIVTEPNYEGSATGTLVISAISYDDWDTDHFTAEAISAGESAPTANPDSDSFSNFAEYALGTDPNLHSPPIPMTLDDTYLSLTFERPKGLGDVSYSALSSSTLLSWSPAELIVIEETETTETVRARVSRPTTTNHVFLRLRVEPLP